jgi:hypothetical protein
MGTFDSWRVVCRVKPEHLALVRDHLATVQGCDDSHHPLVTAHRDFLVKFGHASQFTPRGRRFVHYQPPNGLPSEALGQRNDLDGDVWTFAGSMKNYSGEIDYFLGNVLFDVAAELWECTVLHSEGDEYAYRETYTLEKLAQLRQRLHPRLFGKGDLPPFADVSDRGRDW